MKFYSTKDPETTFSLKEAVLQGLPADNGLFMPESIPTMPATFFEKIDRLSFQEIAFNVSRALLGDDIEDDTLQDIIYETLNFDVPVKHVADDIYCMELFHGPTLAFKDFGARFMARLMSYLLNEGDGKPCILVATSGDTGSAVANGFFQVPGIDVVILYPSGKVSDIQEKQLTTIGGNVTALEINGTFDDCQKLVKTAFLDQELKQDCNLTSANSINIARLIPQSFYYYQAYARLKHLGKKIVCSVPSGNFGNLMGGLIAWKMGLPVHKFIASNNANRVFYDYLVGGVFEAKPSIETISNAMDVGNPSNFVRILDLFHDDWATLKQVVTGYTFNDGQTSEAIKELSNQFGYITDPHGAVGYLGLKEYQLEHSEDMAGVFLGTAHPAKFLDVVNPLLDRPISIPDRLKEAMNSEKQSIPLSSDYTELQAYLLEK